MRLLVMAVVTYCLVKAIYTETLDQSKKYSSLNQRSFFENVWDFNIGSPNRNTYNHWNEPGGNKPPREGFGRYRPPSDGEGRFRPARILDGGYKPPSGGDDGYRPPGVEDGGYKPPSGGDEGYRPPGVEDGGYKPPRGGGTGNKLPSEGFEGIGVPDIDFCKLCMDSRLSSKTKWSKPI